LLPVAGYQLSVISWLFKKMQNAKFNGISGEKKVCEIPPFKSARFAGKLSRE